MSNPNEVIRTDIESGRQAIEIAKEYFPTFDDRACWYVLWNETGYPCFWQTWDAIACLRKQLKAAKRRHNYRLRKRLQAELIEAAILEGVEP